VADKPAQEVAASPHPEEVGSEPQEVIATIDLEEEE